MNCAHRLAAMVLNVLSGETGAGKLNNYRSALGLKLCGGTSKNGLGSRHQRKQLLEAVFLLPVRLGEGPVISIEQAG